MAIETTFSIRNVDVDKALQEAEKKADKSAQKIDQSLNSAGKNSGKKITDTLQQASKGMDSVAKAGGKVGGVLKNLTGGIAGMLNPIGLVSAGITALTALVVHLYDSAKAKAAALLHSHEWELKHAQEQADKATRGFSQDRNYLERLATINTYETVDNATKQEAIRIIDMLTRKYGDLGLSLDETTGKIIGLTEAIKKQNEIQKTYELNAQRTALNAQENILSDKINVVFPRVPKGFWRGLSGRNGKYDETDVLDAFRGDTWWDEYFESVWNSSMTVNSGKVGESPIREKNLKESWARYLKFNSGLYSPDLEKLATKYGKTYEMSPNVQGLFKQYQDLQKLAESSTGEVAEAYKKEATWVMMMLDAMNKIEVAYDMQRKWAEDDEEALKWRDIHEAANKYYNLLEKMRILVSNKINPEDNVTIKEYKEKGQKTSKQMTSAEEAFAQADRRRKSAAKTYAQTGYSKEEMKYALQVEDKRYTEQIAGWIREVKKLVEEYKRLDEVVKGFDKHKNDKGMIEDEGLLKEYLEASNKLAETKLKQLETETKIKNAEADQFGVLARLKALEIDISKEKEKQLLDTLKKRLNNLWSNVLGDYKERTNALTARGGYLKGVNTAIDPVRVNRQILNTVLTSNSILNSIKMAINSAGNI